MGAPHTRGRPRIEAAAPPWFALARYAEAGDMDACDWFLNLALRGEIARGREDKAQMLRRVRGKNPLVRRDQEIFRLGLGDNLPAEIRALLDGREPRSGVEYLTVSELYIVEKRLASDIRAFGASYEHGKTSLKDAPASFTEALDCVLTPRRLSVFARIDLSLPNEVIIEDVCDFLDRVRAEFHDIGGEQPYRDALRALGKKKRGKLLKALAKYPILPLIDLEQWHKDTNTPLPADPAFARNLGMSGKRNLASARRYARNLASARRYAQLLLNDFILRGWLLPRARAVLRIKYDK